MIVQNENETLLWAEQFAKTLKPGAVVAISGISALVNSDFERHLQSTWI